MNKRRMLILFFLVLFIASGCKTVPKYEPPIEPIISPTEVNVNFRFIAYDTGITTPDEDKRCYYKIFIDKIDAGRTTIGLESQKKYFEAKLSSNMHLIVVEKWVLDEREGEYKKVNNILQPKPNFFYFETKASSLTELIMINDKMVNKAQFTVTLQ
ncbi:MAG TPA: hypothetical protein PLH80_01050 [Spirochaetota bacterium]|nr:hypothetical protein [Spirochaetota bacterium]HQI37139.1 hypothetical protein [Spirochaetota bacterium]HQK08204.1 hypothetical protein [Spirochaetota bacterium]